MARSPFLFLLSTPSPCQTMPRWQPLAQPQSDRDYLALLSYLPLRSYLRIPSFFRHTFEIEQQLRASAGLIGYALPAHLLSREFWTVSVWEGDAALMDFVQRAPHSTVMEKLRFHMGPTRFTYWQVSGAAIPPTWQEARGRMHA